MLRKSKPECIKLRRLCKAAAAALAVVLLPASVAAARPAATKVVRLSRDTLTTPEAQHATEVEPDSLAVGTTVVTAFQVGRFFDGGASAIGFATSRDGGATWRSGLLSQLTTASTPPGPANRATDPAVAYDAAHGRWLVESLTLSGSSAAVVVSGSTDGLTWSAPSTAISLPFAKNGDTNLDKS